MSGAATPSQPPPPPVLHWTRVPRVPSLANLTIAVDAEVLRRARIRALRQGTSVNALLRKFLADYAGAADERVKAIAELIEMSRRTRASSGGRRWRREDLYE